MQDPHIEIRQAAAEDFEPVASLMETALSPFYDGDHRAHAERIFSTHIQGGIDSVGHFSHEQRMFVVTVDGQVAGVIHVVGKRQATYKISPLIIGPEFQGRLGLGTHLLRFAEEYASQNDARQVYCTVASENRAARAFFVRNGYIVAGNSASHYKVGMTELMLYKPLKGASTRQLDRDKIHISVLPYEDQYRGQAERLILDTLPQTFDGVNETWVEALFEGYRRRDSGDVNAKYKLIYLAVDRKDMVLGIVGATPKKGQPIKLMPLIAATQPAFEALLHDVPHLLAEYGHKLYTHMVPNVQQTTVLQRLGWRLDAAMPGAYREDQVTQQWSFSLEGGVMRTLRVKKRFFDLIVSGLKDLEVRVGYDNIRTVTPGERIQITTHESARVIRVLEVRRYRSFEEMLAVERAERIAPGLSRDQVLALLREIYPPHKERLGVVVLQIQPEDRPQAA